MSCFVFPRYFVVISINTNFFIPLYRDPLNFVLAVKGDFDHSYEKFLTEEEVDLAASQRQGTAVSWMTLGKGFSAVSVRFLICDMGQEKDQGWVGSEPWTVSSR